MGDVLHTYENGREMFEEEWHVSLLFVGSVIPFSTWDCFSVS